MTINSYATLTKWLSEDLDYLNSKKIPIQKLKSHLNDILQDSGSANSPVEKKIKEKIQKAIYCNDHEFLKFLRRIYLLSFFSKQIYIQKQKSLKIYDVQEVINKRIETLNYPQTLAFVIFFSDEEKNLSQISKASLLIKSSLDFFLSEIISSTNDKAEKDKFSNYIFGSSFCLNNKNKSEKLLISKESNYIVVAVEGSFYKFVVVANGKSISVDSIKMGLEKIIKDLKETSSHIGTYSSASKLNRYRIKRKHSKRNWRSFAEIEKALFVVCLDLIPYGKNAPEEIFSHRFRNRYFGSTQLVIGTKGESAAIVSYAKIDGIPAIEAFKQIYNNSNSLEYPNKSTNEVTYKKINLRISKKHILRIEKDVSKILHNKNSSFVLDISPDFFKRMNLSPNITLNFLLMLATFDFIGDYPVINHAVSRSNTQLSSSELDWIYMSPIYIEKFHKQFIKYSEIFSNTSFKESKNSSKQFNGYEFNNVTKNWKDISFSTECSGNFQKSEMCLLEKNALSYRNFLLNSGYKSALIDLEKMFRIASSDHADRIRMTKEGLSPTFFLTKPKGILFDELVKFYLQLGTYVPAYRNYLFRAYRNSKSIDIMTSSLKLPPEIKSLGRHGSCSDLFSCYGLHILFKGNIIELVFIPNKNFEGDMEKLVNRLHQWLFLIKTIFG